MATATNHPVTFILVPGSFVLATEYDKVISLLTQHKTNNPTTDIQVRAIDLPTANDGSKLPPSTWSDDVSHIRSSLLHILDTEHRDAVLVLHSYAGSPGSSATQGLSKSARLATSTTSNKDNDNDPSTENPTPTSLLGILYIGSFLPSLTQSVRDLLRPLPSTPESFLTGLPGAYLPSIPPEQAPYIFNDVQDPAEVTKYHNMMVRHSNDAFDGKVTYEPWNGRGISSSTNDGQGNGDEGIQCTQLIPENDLIVPVSLQEEMYTRIQKEGGKVNRVFLEGAGHCPNVSRPEAVVEEMLRLAGMV